MSSLTFLDLRFGSCEPDNDITYKWTMIIISISLNKFVRDFYYKILHIFLYTSAIGFKWTDRKHNKELKQCKYDTGLMQLVLSDMINYKLLLYGNTLLFIQR